MARGGYRAPRKPAPVSGPGAHSRRTDTQPKRQLPDAKYGEQAEFQAAQAAAPLPTGVNASASGPPPLPEAVQRVVPLGADSMRPDEPITAGAASGPGPGLDALALPALDPDTPAKQHLRNVLPALEIVAAAPHASRSLQQYVRFVRSQMG